MQRSSVPALICLAIILPAGCSRSEPEPAIGSTVPSSISLPHGEPAAFGYNDIGQGYDCDPPLPDLSSREKLEAIQRDAIEFLAAQEAVASATSDDRPPESDAIDN